jgi:hypothetical protein
MLYTAKDRHKPKAGLNLPSIPATGFMDSTSPNSKVYVLKRPQEESTPPKLSRNYAEELNPQQLAAVEVVEGPALVIAGAGSGKTRTLVYRVARLIDLGI